MKEVRETHGKKENEISSAELKNLRNGIKPKRWKLELHKCSAEGCVQFETTPLLYSH